MKLGQRRGKESTSISRISQSDLRLVSLPFAYAALSCAWVLLTPVNFDGQVQPYLTHLNSAHKAGQTLVWILGGWLTLRLFMRATGIARSLLQGLYVAAVLPVFFGHPEGVATNSALNSILILSTIAYVPWWLILPGLVAAYMTHQWITWAIVSFRTLIWLSRRGHWVEALGAGIAASAAAAYQWSQGQGEHFTDRWNHWDLAFSAAWNYPWFGHGGGSFYHGFPHLQILNGGFKQDVWTWAHNDYLQVFYEYGWIGFSLTMLALVTLLRRAWPKRGGLSYTAWLTGALFHFPLHDPATIAVGLALMALALTG